MTNTTLILTAAIVAIASGAGAENATANGGNGIALKEVASYVMAVGGAVMLLGGGWVSFLQLRFGRLEHKASGIGRALDDEKRKWDGWRDAFLERYHADRERMISEYATQASVEKVEERMEAIRRELVEGMRGIQGSIDKMRDAMKKTGG